MLQRAVYTDTIQSLIIKYKFTQEYYIIFWEDSHAYIYIELHVFVFVVLKACVQTYFMSKKPPPCSCKHKSANWIQYTKYVM